MDHQELDAARALLGVSPPEVSIAALPAEQFDDSVEEAAAAAEEEFPFRKRPRSDSAGLDALAALASQEQLKEEKKPLQVTFSEDTPAITSSSSEDEEGEGSSSNNMPPPPPRFRRRRSASNPEGMEKWDSLGPSNKTTRRHFVLPASILESELAEANAAVKEQNRRQPDKENKPKEDDDEEEEVDESTLTPDELLRRARSRLLEDLSEGTVNGEKGVLTLPHALSKYKEVRFLAFLLYLRLFVQSGKMYT